MEKDLMLKIKNDLAELKHNGADIKKIEQFTNIENQQVVRFTNNEGDSFIIRIEEEF